MDGQEVTLIACQVEPVLEEQQQQLLLLLLLRFSCCPARGNVVLTTGDDQFVKMLYVLAVEFFDKLLQVFHFACWFFV